jgi:hypothetical protein
VNSLVFIGAKVGHGNKFSVERSGFHRNG